MNFDQPGSGGGCFICGEAHRARDCPLKGAVNDLVKQRKAAAGGAAFGDGGGGTGANRPLNGEGGSQGVQQK